MVLNETQKSIPNTYSYRLKGMTKWLLTKEHEERPYIFDILKSNFMAPALLEQGYEPKLIVALSDQIKDVIKQKERDLRSPKHKS